MASLQARHQRGCKLDRPWTTFADATKAKGCTCAPMYHVVSAATGGKLDRVAVGRNRKEAERRLTKTQNEQNEGEYQPLRRVPFDKWADEWLAGLKRPGESTRATYRVAMQYAREAFGSRVVRDLNSRDIDRFLAVVKDLNSSTQAKHLRALNACLNSAVRKGVAGRNPIALLGPDEKPREEEKEAEYFEDEEIPRLLAAFSDEDRPLFRLALMTPIRQEALLSLTWGDVDLKNAEIRVSKDKTQAGRRNVDIGPAAVQLLREQREALGAIPHPSMLVFPGSRGKRSASWTTKALYKAMAAAVDPDTGEPKPIPRVGPCGTERVFHSLKHTYARIALENGAELTWLRRQMGHSSVAFTDKRYGHWARAARKKQTEALTKRGAFAF